MDDVDQTDGDTGFDGDTGLSVEALLDKIQCELDPDLPKSFCNDIAETSVPDSEEYQGDSANPCVDSSVIETPREPDEADSNEQDCCASNTYLFMPLPNRDQLEENAIRASISGEDPLLWPTSGPDALDEFKTEGLASKCFPTLFPYGRGDPACRARKRAVSLTDGFKHLMKYGELSSSGVLTWRFASHPRFPYWALNMRQQNQTLSQSRIFVSQNPQDALLTSSVRW